MKFSKVMMSFVLILLQSATATASSSATDFSTTDKEDFPEIPAPLMSEDFLGTLCIIDVNTESDKNAEGYGIYALPPCPGYLVGIYGPGRPKITPDGQLKLWLSEVKLELMDDTEGKEYLEVCIYKPYATQEINNWNSIMPDDYWQHPEYVGYYVIELVVTTTPRCD